VLVFGDRKVRSWPKHQDGPDGESMSLSDLVIRHFATDAHFVCYFSAKCHRRLAKDAAGRVPELAMVVLAFDIDCPASHRASGGTAGTPAPDDWFNAEREKLNRLRAAQPGTFVYRTRGGYRILACLPSPFPINGSEDGVVWSREYLAWCAYLERVYGIAADKGCRDWTRMFRASHATRDPGGQPEQREIIGDPHQIGFWRDEREPADYGVADGLLSPRRRRQLRKAKERRKRFPDGLLRILLHRRGLIGLQIAPGKTLVRCPADNEHGCGEAYDSSTVLFAGDMKRREALHCSHSNCGHDRLRGGDWLRYFSPEEITLAEEDLVAQTREAGDWEGALLRSASGAALSGLANTLSVLGLHPEWGGTLAYDDFAGRVIARQALPVRPQEDTGEASTAELGEDDAARTAAWIASNAGFEPSVETVLRAMTVVAKRTRVHPVRDYFSSLAWDGIPRVDGMLTAYFGAPESDYVRGVSSRFLIAAVARVFEPGCQVDCVPVLEGAQGIGKSSGLRALVGDQWFSDTPIDLSNKDCYLALHRVWLYELSELDALRGKDAARIKSYISSRVDHYRPPFGRKAEQFPRQTVFCGTTNETEYLVDRTGNRRFWPVRCTAVDVAGIARDRDQLWAEAYYRYQQGEAFHVNNAELRSQCEQEQQAREVTDPWVEAIVAWLNRPTVPVQQRDGIQRQESIDLRQGVTTAQVLAGALGLSPDRAGQHHSGRVGSILRSLGLCPTQERQAGVRVRRYYLPGHGVSQVSQVSQPFAGTPAQGGVWQEYVPTHLHPTADNGHVLAVTPVTAVTAAPLADAAATDTAEFGADFDAIDELLRDLP
jgi:hypothetical protein